jgi:hypothetical protein
MVYISLKLFMVHTTMLSEQITQKERSITTMFTEPDTMIAEPENYPKRNTEREKKTPGSDQK